MNNEYLWHYNDDEYLTFAKQYIKGRTNHLVLFHKLSQETSQNLGTATLLGDASLDGAYNKMLNIATTEMSLTKKECEEIKDWILSNIN